MAFTGQWITRAQLALPPAADGVSVTPSGSVWGNSSWVELVASISGASLLTGIVVRHARAADFQLEVDIGVGAAAAESVIATVKARNIGNTIGSGGSYFQLPIPIDAIPNNSRVACRIRTSDTNTTAMRISATYIPSSPAVGTLLTSANPTLVNPSAANLDVDTPGGAWTNTAWRQLIASLGSDIVVVGVVVATPNQMSEFDLGVGGAGAESVVYTFACSNITGTAQFPGYYPLPIPLDVYVSGNRVSWRGRNSSALEMRFGIVYMAKPL